ncbi:MAG: T9SS type A sorting domain-containing protein [Chitinophagaceae bacterium]|nr:MAG: T9SS type A sorting domain-containing protein [Chitinophagaceae bacterium]
MMINTGLTAQSPRPTEFSVSEISTVNFSYSGSAGKDKFKAEVPPWIIPGGLRSYFFVDGSDTYIWSSSASIVHDRKADLNDAVGPALASASYIRTPGYHPSNKINNWKRNYHAIYSANYISHPVQGPVSIGFLHGENKNQVVGKISSEMSPAYQNTIQPNVTINPNDHRTYSGGEPFLEGWLAYNAMISAAWVPNNAGTNWGQQFFNNELGPITWPSTGYVTVNGVKCTSGLKHPSSIVADGYIYVFYTDGGPFGANIHHEEGRHEGVKVVRAKIEDALDPHAYAVYYKDPSGIESWLPALPAGFTKENMLDYVAVRGSKSADLMNDVHGTSQEVRFSVAKVRDADYYIGVEEYIDIADGKKFKVAFRYSDDLVNWGDRVVVVYESPEWSKTKMNYPVFLDKEGWNNTEVDIDDFYILGTGINPQKMVNKIHIKSVNPLSQSLAIRPVSTFREIRENLLYPNPNNGTFNVNYVITEPSRIRISLLNTAGINLGVLKTSTRNPGKHSDSVNMNLFPAGIYFVEMKSNTETILYKIVKN